MRTSKQALTLPRVLGIGLAISLVVVGFVWIPLGMSLGCSVIATSPAYPNVYQAHGDQALGEAPGHSLMYNSSTLATLPLNDRIAVLSSVLCQHMPVKPKLVAAVGHSKSVNSIAQSSDAKWLATASDDRTVCLWAAQTGRLHRVFLGHTDYVASVFFSPDGKQLFTTSGDKTVRIWDVLTGEQVRSLGPIQNAGPHVALSADSRWLAVECDSRILVLDTTTGKLSRTLEGQKGYLKSLVISTDGKWVASGNNLGTVCLWDVTRTEPSRSFLGHDGDIPVILINGSASCLVTGGSDKTVRLWEIRSGKEIFKLVGHTDQISAVALSCDGKWLATGSLDWTARLWDVRDGKQVRQFGGPEIGPISSVAINADGSLLIAGTAAGEIAAWNTGNEEIIKRFIGYTEKLSSMLVNQEGTRLVANSYACTPFCWDLKKGTPLPRFHTGDPWSYPCFDGDWGAVQNHGDSVTIFDLVSGKEIAKFLEPAGIASFSISKNKKLIAAGLRDNTVKIWQYPGGKVLATLKGHMGVVKALQFMSGDTVLVSGDRVGAINLWDSATWTCKMCLKGHRHAVNSVSASADGEFVVTCSNDNTTRIWSSKTGKEILCNKNFNSGIRSATLTADCRLCVTVNVTEGVWIWPTKIKDDGKNVDHQIPNGVCATLSADGKCVFIGLRDGTNCIWDVERRCERCRFVSFRDGTWAVYDSLGRFDASEKCLVPNLYWVIGERIEELAHLKRTHYDPGLLAKCISNVK